MPKGSGQKRKLLELARILLENTDEDHPMSTAEVIEALERLEIAAERKSVYDDMEQLRQAGLDVQCRKGKTAGWFIGEREFQLAELKLLVDAAQASRFLTARKSGALIAKLEGLASVHQARQLQRQVYVAGRIKTMNESIYYNVDKLHTAIGTNRAVTFRYFEYNMRKEKVFRRAGARYRVSPYGLIWDNENYYLAGWDGEKGDVRHYRVDKMAELTVTAQPRDMEHAVDMERYAQRHFSMFAGQEAQIRLRCASRLAGVVLDRFGHDVILVPDGDAWFTVTMDVAVSPQFWGWLFGLEDNVEVLAPDWAVEEYRRRLVSLAERYAPRKLETPPPAGTGQP